MVQRSIVSFGSRNNDFIEPPFRPPFLHRQRGFPHVQAQLRSRSKTRMTAASPRSEPGGTTERSIRDKSKAVLSICSTTMASDPAKRRAICCNSDLSPGLGGALRPWTGEQLLFLRQCPGRRFNLTCSTWPSRKNCGTGSRHLPFSSLSRRPSVLKMAPPPELVRNEHRFVIRCGTCRIAFAEKMRTITVAGSV